jgi:hypothetical protein
MNPLFFQPYCTVVPYQAGGALVAGSKRGCAVIITDGELMIDGGALVSDRAPISGVQIDTPALQRKVGASTFVQMNGHKWAIDFGMIGQLDRSERRGPLKKIKFARERNREFADLLVREGATTLRS